MFIKLFELLITNLTCRVLLARDNFKIFGKYRQLI